MAKPILNCPRVVALVCERVAAGVPQHVRVNLEREAGALTDALDQAIDGIGCERCAALSLEHIAAAGLALELPECAEFVAANRVRCRLAILSAPNMQGGRAIKLDLRPF